jgi:amino acid adenylation domain-containing protein
MKTEEIEDIYELSPMQQGMLFHTLHSPEAGFYFTQLSCTLPDRPNVRALEQAWQQVVDRYSVLRTSFHWEELTKPVQVVHQHVKLPLEQYDWRRLSATEQEARLNAYLQSDQRCGFELSKAPLMRLTLIQMSEDTFQFIWSHHQMLLDGWSKSLLLKEVFAWYEAFCRGQEFRSERSRPYGDYIDWLQQQDLSKAEAFWRAALQGFTGPTPLSVGRDPGYLADHEESAGSQQLSVSQTTTAALRSLARQHQLTLNTLVQGTWALLLNRYSGEEDVLFGVTVAGRPATLVGVEAMVGLFINTLPLRVRISPKASLLPWLKALQTQQFELREYEYSPLVAVQGWSELPRGLPLFESILVFENYPGDRSLRQQGGSLPMRNVRSIERTNYPLTVTAVPGAELSLRINYDRQRFDPATIRRMLGHLQTLLEGMVADPFQPLASLPLLTAAEWQQLLVEWNDTATAYAPERCLHALFEAQVERTPEALAVRFEDQTLTYRELNARANQLAHHLRGLGVGPEVLVGLCVERSLEMVVGLLGILKAGGAYVPLDPTYPPERLAFMLADTQAPLLLTQQRLLEALPLGDAGCPYRGRIICLDAEETSFADESEENLVTELSADNLAYLIYTSGSTGKPKGVLVTHANVGRLFEATQPWFHFNERDVWTLFHSYAFDFSVWELWGALLYGGRLVVVPYWVSRSPEAFYNLLCAERVTVLNQTPSAFRQLMRADEAANRGKELTLRWVIFGGEALELKNLRPWFERHGDQSPRLGNMYGITETTVHVTYRPLTVADLETACGSVIGVPLPDLQVYVLDRNLQLVPVGVPGEIYVGGAGVARGYLNRPALTAERFIELDLGEPRPCSLGVEEAGPNAQRSTPNAQRLYKSGDLARYLPNGELEYLGRLDHQVKIRGFRVELGEIEAVLSQHPAVREAVVATEDSTGSGRLVAYVVREEGRGLRDEGGDDPSAPDAQRPTPDTVIGELRQYLRERLPEYMVPSLFVLLEALPLTPNGKVDRRALPAPEAGRLELGEPYVAPRSPVEAMLTGIWADILEVEQVGVHVNFFELGGHSLLATQVISRVRTAFQVELPLRRLFEVPTVAGLALLILESLTDEALGDEIPGLLAGMEELPETFG